MRICGNTFGFEVRELIDQPPTLLKTRQLR
ncbi:hypothetical protein MCBMB27_05350 [Methylobacterium phyllosphaerae]|jgi:hypothetical protein|uniref:Uncharacterized protein n=1 Tax=Methylobacterium phyllosphaerae TaxID=418223 RepID=A0AAE8HVE9_9HYPH|nr:hypothetical protein MCBMB27_05350 [Methylobacterium phyllosphaerae]SFH38282.1 hypothetical protein SAMN05192567_12266 [Methylobacterium phyllosphaerae]